MIRTGRHALLPWALALLAGLLLLPGCGGQPPAGAVVVLPAHGEVNAVLSGYIERGLRAARTARAPAIVIELDTPGGLDSSMRQIIRAMTASPVPVIVYVAPPGARAASAGTFITEAAGLAAMAPGTNIGAASPVTASGGDIGGTEGKKVTNDAVAFIRSLAAEHGRNADWAESAVRQAAALPANEALAQHVVDLIAPDLPSLLQQADGRAVLAAGAHVVLQTRGRQTATIKKDPAERLLDVISDPNIAFLLVTVGGLALAFEVIHPTLVTGIVGVITFVLGLFALGSLPTNWAALALILLAFGLFVADIYVGGTGVLAAGGVAALIGGGLLLVSGAGTTLHVSRWLVLGVALAIGALFIRGIAALYRSRRRPSVVGERTMIGQKAVARTALDPAGYVAIDGENWKARLDAGTAAPGESVRVVAVQGLELFVTRMPDASPPLPAAPRPPGMRVDAG